MDLEYKNIARALSMSVEKLRNEIKKLDSAGKLSDIIEHNDNRYKVLNNTRYAQLGGNIGNDDDAAMIPIYGIGNAEGNIVIDRCEAMTVIDVNSGSAASGSVFLGTNLSACGTIAAQIRLRNLSGIILIDFIDMDREEDRNAVGETLRECLERDRRKTVIHGWTKLGILEMTRKRV